jgi:hypothetical protein
MPFLPITEQIVHCNRTRRLNLKMKSGRDCLTRLKRKENEAGGQAWIANRLQSPRAYYLMSAVANPW